MCGRKIVILASIAFSCAACASTRSHTRGHRHVDRDDVTFAAELGYAVKLLGRAALGSGGLLGPGCPHARAARTPPRACRGKLPRHAARRCDPGGHAPGAAGWAVPDGDRRDRRPPVGRRDPRDLEHDGYYRNLPVLAPEDVVSAKLRAARRRRPPGRARAAGRPLRTHDLAAHRRAPAPPARWRGRARRRAPTARLGDLGLGAPRGPGSRLRARRDAPAPRPVGLGFAETRLGVTHKNRGDRRYPGANMMHAAPAPSAQCSGDRAPPVRPAHVGGARCGKCRRQEGRYALPPRLRVEGPAHASIHVIGKREVWAATRGTKAQYVCSRTHRRRPSARRTRLP